VVVLSIAQLEDICESQEITLVMHPAVRAALRGYEESFHIGLKCFLKGETDGLFFLPLRNGGHVRLRFAKRTSVGEFSILRIDPEATEALQRIKQAFDGAGTAWSS
jgi:hypothetical protein